MTAVFADTFYFLALLNSRDAAHRKAVDFSNSSDAPLLTTAWVLTELADGLSRSSKRDFESSADSTNRTLLDLAVPGHRRHLAGGPVDIHRVAGALA